MRDMISTENPRRIAVVQPSSSVTFIVALASLEVQPADRLSVWNVTMSEVMLSIPMAMREASAR